MYSRPEETARAGHKSAVLHSRLSAHWALLTPGARGGLLRVAGVWDVLADSPDWFDIPPEHRASVIEAIRGCGFLKVCLPAPEPVPPLMEVEELPRGKGVPVPGPVEREAFAFSDLPEEIRRRARGQYFDAGPGDGWWYFFFTAPASGVVVLWRNRLKSGAAL